MVQSPTSSSGEEEEEEDFMSDKFLDVATASAPGGKKAGSASAETYSERRRKELNRATERGRILSRAERERLARQQGLGRSLIEIAEGEDRGKRKREEEEKEQGESKALRMMKAMGYVAGDALGKKDDGGGNDDDKEAPSIDKEADGEKGRDMTAPLPIDERWIGARVRHGIGLLSRSIHAASAKQAEEAAKGDLEDFRKRATKEHEARHCEVLLKRARKTCEDLDRQQDIEYSPLWLDPQLLYIKKDDLAPDRARLIEQALDEEDEEEHEATGATKEGSKEPEQTPSQRRQEAKQFINLEPKARLDITLSHLRFAHFYCLFCGEKYASQDEMQQVCPGEEEDDH